MGVRFPRGMLLGSLALAFAAAAMFGLWRVWGNLRGYLALRAADPSGAEVYLDGAWIWGAPSLVALLVAALCVWAAMRRRREPDAAS